MLFRSHPAGCKVAKRCLVKQTKKKDGELVGSRIVKVVKVKARDTHKGEEECRGCYYQLFKSQRKNTL